VTAAFVSDQSALIEAHQPALWVHGHVHNSSDYRVRRTRVVCNPHGYGTENPDFDGALVVEVSE
jgi:Icc-related predicted phosphoesterase